MTSSRTIATAAELLEERAGFRVDTTMGSRVRRCVREGATAAGLEVRAYVDALRGDSTLFQDLLDRITVQETWFFRDPEQFALLRDVVLPTLPGPVNVWSAGCANGQEAYSLAITLEEAGRHWSVVASDISAQAVERARSGTYTLRELRGLTARQREHLVGSGDRWQIDPALRRRVTVVQHNLADDAPPAAAAGCHVVFCRNVLIYLRRSEVTAVLDRVADLLGPGGWLFVGGAETLVQLTERYRAVGKGKAFAFRVVDEHAPDPAERRAAPLAPDRRPAPPPRARPLPDARSLLAQGEQAAAEGDHLAAVTAFRRAAFVAPEDPLTHLQLGFALDAAGDAGGARRAYAAARAALGRADDRRVEAVLEGYTSAALRELLDARLGDA